MKRNLPRIYTHLALTLTAAVLLAVSPHAHAAGDCEINAQTPADFFMKQAAALNENAQGAKVSVEQIPVAATPDQTKVPTKVMRSKTPAGIEEANTHVKRMNDAPILKKKAPNTAQAKTLVITETPDQTNIPTIVITTKAPAGSAGANTHVIRKGDTPTAKKTPRTDQATTLVIVKAPDQTQVSTKVERATVSPNEAGKNAAVLEPIKPGTEGTPVLRAKSLGKNESPTTPKTSEALDLESRERMSAQIKRGEVPALIKRELDELWGKEPVPRIVTEINGKHASPLKRLEARTGIKKKEIKDHGLYLAQGNTQFVFTQGAHDTERVVKVIQPSEANHMKGTKGIEKVTAHIKDPAERARNIEERKKEQVYTPALLVRMARAKHEYMRKRGWDVTKITASFEDEAHGISYAEKVGGMTWDELCAMFGKRVEKSSPNSHKPVTKYELDWPQGKQHRADFEADGEGMSLYFYQEHGIGIPMLDDKGKVMRDPVTREAQLRNTDAHPDNFKYVLTTAEDAAKDSKNVRELHHVDPETGVTYIYYIRIKGIDI